MVFSFSIVVVVALSYFHGVMRPLVPAAGPMSYIYGVATITVIANSQQ